MTVTRRSLLTASVAASSIVGCPAILRAAGQAEFSYKYGVELPATHPTSTGMQKAAARIKAETNGRLDIQVFPNRQLGSATDMISQLRSGALEFCSQPGPVLSTFIPATAIDGIGFAFKDDSAIWPAHDGELGAYIRGQIQKSGLVVANKIWSHGFRHMTSSVGPIKVPADLRALKIRVPAGPIFISLFKALSASTMTINFNETYSALQTRVADAEENPIALIVTAKLYEVQKYLSLTKHMWAGYWFLANKDAWDALPSDVQGIVRRVVDECADEQRAELARQDTTYQKELTAKGLLINDVDITPFRDALSKSGYYKEWQRKFGDQAWGALEKYAGRLA